MAMSELAEAFKLTASAIPTAPKQDSKLWTNAVVAQVIADHFGNRLVWDHSIGSFWIYNPKGYFMAVADIDLLREQVMVQMTHWGIKSITMARVEDIIGQLRLRVTRYDDLDDRYISFLDCLWSPETGQTTTFDGKEPDLTKIATLHIPITFSDVQKSACPKFYKYIHETCIKESGEFDDGMKNQLQEFAGYLLWPKLESCPCLFLFGDGSNGKSVYIDVLRGLVGKTRTSSCGLDQLINNRFGMAALVGIRFNASDEMGNCRESTTADFKKMVFGDPIQTERKFRDAFTLIPKAKHAYNVNRIPAFGEVNLAMRRRILIIPFYNRLNPFVASDRAKTIKHLGQIIVDEELPGVVRWAIEGLERLKKNDFWMTSTPASEEMMMRFEEESSSVIEYLREKFIADDEARFRSEDAYNEYVTWCKDVGRRPVSRSAFGRDFTEVFGRPISYRQTDGTITKGFRAKKRNLIPQIGVLEI